MPASLLPLPERYEDLGRIGLGGMAEVRRVRDRLLRASVAMKIGLAEALTDPLLRRRFAGEARLTAQLHHPGIIAVHDLGELPDGRLFFTMEEVRGQNLAQVLPTLSLREGVAVVMRAAQAVGYAHQQGVIHRDLKPENLMVAAHDEVRVMDWGIARQLGEPDALGDVELGPGGGGETRLGHVLGTVAWMPPEQAQGRSAALGPEADVYSLGATLYALISGQAPFGGPDAWQRLTSGPPAPLTEGPSRLIEICSQAMSRQAWERYPNAGLLAQALSAWLNEDAALTQVTQARALLPRLRGLHLQAEQAQAQAMEILGPLAPHAPAEGKAPGWRAEDQASELRHKARLLEVEIMQGLRSALSQAPELREAHALLAERYKARALAAEARGDRDAVADSEALVQVHDRGEHAAWLRGDGAFSLVTDPPAKVTWFQLVERDRRLVPEARGVLGSTPIHGHPLPRGSHLLILDAPGRLSTVYPVFIERGQHWSGVEPDGTAPHPIRLPKQGELDDSEVLVPAGWFWSGGDPNAADGLPARRLWADAFVIRAHPVTNLEYLAFLNAPGVDAERWLPRDKNTGQRPVFVQGAEGWSLGERAQGRADPEAPVTAIDWWAARRYAEWASEVSGLPWRLPHDLEWEKAGRGVDRRACPWGDHVEPTWACVVNSRPTPPQIAPVGDFPLDLGPYGTCGQGGNVRDWCANPYLKGGLPSKARRVALEPGWEPDSHAFVMMRGGGWSSTARQMRLAGRFADPPQRRYRTLGFRICRSVS